jgi:hypothetical protein
MNLNASMCIVYTRKLKTTEQYGTASKWYNGILKVHKLLYKNKQTTEPLFSVEVVLKIVGKKAEWLTTISKIDVTFRDNEHELSAGEYIKATNRSISWRNDGLL